MMNAISALNMKNTGEENASQTADHMNNLIRDIVIAKMDTTE